MAKQQQSIGFHTHEFVQFHAFTQQAKHFLIDMSILYSFKVLEFCHQLFIDASHTQERERSLVPKVKY